MASQSAGISGLVSIGGPSSHSLMDPASSSNSGSLLCKIPYRVFLRIVSHLNSIQDLLSLSQTNYQLHEWAYSEQIRLPGRFSKAYAAEMLSPHPQLLFHHYASEFAEKYYAEVQCFFHNETSPLGLSQAEREALTLGTIFRGGLHRVLRFCEEYCHGMTLKDIATLQRKRRSLERSLPLIQHCINTSTNIPSIYHTVAPYPRRPFETIVNFFNLCLLFKPLPPIEEQPGTVKGFADLRYRHLVGFYLRTCLLPISAAADSPLPITFLMHLRLEALYDMAALVTHFSTKDGPPGPTAPFENPHLLASQFLIAFVSIAATPPFRQLRLQRPSSGAAQMSSSSSTASTDSSSSLSSLSSSVARIDEAPPTCTMPGHSHVGCPYCTARPQRRAARRCLRAFAMAAGAWERAGSRPLNGPEALRRYTLLESAGGLLLELSHTMRELERGDMSYVDL